MQVTILSPPAGMTWAQFMEARGEDAVRAHWVASRELQAWHGRQRQCLADKLNARAVDLRRRGVAAGLVEEQKS
jgi:hypothetical protein